MDRLRITYIVHHYPQISETYIQSEIESLAHDAKIQIISLEPPDISFSKHSPYCQIEDVGETIEAIDAFQPHVLHSHWLFHARLLGYFAGYFGRRLSQGMVPFTIRAHSFDTLGPGTEQTISEIAPIINSDLCLGIVAFPFSRSILERLGIHSDQIHDSYPVVNYERFYDTSPNGDAIMNVGACLPKKRMEDFLRLGSLVPGRLLNLYAMGYMSDQRLGGNRENHRGACGLLLRGRKSTRARPRCSSPPPSSHHLSVSLRPPRRPSPGSSDAPHRSAREYLGIPGL